jgi:alpha-galactosidase
MNCIPKKVNEESKTDNTAVIVSPDCEVRFTSGKTICVEALAGGQWVCRYRSADGNVKLPHWQFAQPAFHIVIKNEPLDKEISLSAGWQWVSAGEMSGTKKDRRHFTIELSNTIVPITVKVHTLLDGTAVLTRWLEITNTSDKPVAIAAVAPWAGRLWNEANEDVPITLGCSTIHSIQVGLGSFAWRPLEIGSNVIQNTREPCHDDPYFILHNESNGEYFFGELAWPSLYRMVFDKTEHDGLVFGIGPTTIRGELARVLSPGETVQTPAVHLCHHQGDFDAVVQEMHEHVRRSVLPEHQPDRSHRVEYIANNDTGTNVYTGKDFTEENLRKCIDVAAAVGAELFLIDGPYWAQIGGKHGWDWLNGDNKLFPDGLKALRDYAHQKGLLFGVYARTEGIDMLTSGAPDMFETVSGMIEKHGLDLYRHDTSANQWTHWLHPRVQHGFEECIAWRHHNVFYNTAERLRRKYPNVILQQAHGGGARCDLATIGHWHENFQSDYTHLPLAYQMRAGLSVYLPPEVMQSTYFGMCGTPPDKITVKRCIYALGNIPCIFWTLLPAKVNEISPEELNEWRKYTNLYKSFIRPLLSMCKVYHHAPISAKDDRDTGDWFVEEFISPDRTKGWAVIISYPESRSLTYPFCPKGVDEQKTYKVTFDNRNETKTYSGSNLKREGILIHVGSEVHSELLLFESV